MAISPAQKRAIEEVIDTLCNATKGRRKLCEMFMQLPDKTTWSQYYEVIPEPRCIDGIKTAVDKGKYKDTATVYDDISLVFANALHYNEADSQIAKDAITLRQLFEESWKNNSTLPAPPVSSPPESEEPVPMAATQPVIVVPPPSEPHFSQEASSSSLPPTIIRPIMATSILYTPQPHPTADEDGDMSPEPQEQEQETHSWEFAARDEESTEIVRQLERGLPRWEGGDDRGWMENVPGDSARKYMQIIDLLKGYRTALNQRPSASLDEIPEDASVKDLSFSEPISFKIIENRIRSQYYPTAHQFDQDMSRLFERARRWHTAGTEAYGRAILLQRLYHHLSSPPFPDTIPLTTSNFSSISAGPGVAKPLHSSGSESAQAVTTFRIPTKDRVFTDEMTFKGMTIRVGDWVHLMNPDDPAKPIIAQVFKTWVPDGDGKRQQGITACWYFRPEQTIHPAHRQFWEGEVFKTGHFADHVAEDVIEKIACQFTAKHVRGRPRPPYWHPGWPLYVCDSRYNDRERVFVKIKNWNSCIPEDYRKNDFMPIYPFERIIYPKRYPSPFLTGITGPGGIGDSIERAEGEKIEGGGTGRRRSRRAATGQANDHAGPRYGTFVGTPNTMASGGRAANVSTHPVPHPPILPVQQQKRVIEDRSIGTAAGGLSNLQGNATVEVLPADTVKHFDRDPETNQVLWFSGPPIDVARTPLPQYSLKYLHYTAMEKKRQRTREDDGEGQSPSQRNEDLDQPMEKRQKFLPKPRVSESLAALWDSVAPK